MFTPRLRAIFSPPTHPQTDKKATPEGVALYFVAVGRPHYFFTGNECSRIIGTAEVQYFHE